MHGVVMNMVTVDQNLFNILMIILWILFNVVKIRAMFIRQTGCISYLDLMMIMNVKTCKDDVHNDNDKAFKPHRIDVIVKQKYKLKEIVGYYNTNIIAILMIY